MYLQFFVLLAAVRLHVAQADRRRVRNSAAIDLQIDRSIAVRPFHRGTEFDDDDDVPIKLAKGVYGDRLIDRDPKSSAIRSTIV